MPCRLLLDSLNTPVRGSIRKVILSFPETMLYLHQRERAAMVIIVFQSGRIPILTSPHLSLCASQMSASEA